MARKFEYDEQAAFREEQEHLEKTEQTIDSLIRDAKRRYDEYNSIVVNKEYVHIDDKFEYLGMARSCNSRIFEYRSLKHSPYYGRIDIPSHL